MSKTGYSVNSTAAVALAAATAKSVIGVKSAADFGLDLIGFEVAFDGVTASATPVVIEVCYSTFASNGPGTNSTSRTPAQMYGRTIAHGVTAASNWTTEPTALTVLERHLLTPNGGYEPRYFSLGQTPDSAVGEGFVIRITAPAIVNAEATLFWERA